MSDIVVLDGELSLDVSMDGECGTYMQVGEDPAIESLEVTENGTYTVGSGVDGFNPVSVNVPAPEPSIESLTVTENGTYTATGDGYDPVIVNVPSEEPTISALSITENGTYAAPEDTDGYSPVTVNVPSKWTLLTSVTMNISTTSTSAQAIGTISLGSFAYTTNKFLYIKIRDTAGKRNGHLYGSDSFLSNVNTVNESEYNVVVSMREGYMITDGGTLSSKGSGQYGVYPYYLDSDGNVIMRARYASSWGIIDGTFQIDVYMLDTPDGSSVFS